MKKATFLIMALFLIVTLRAQEKETKEELAKKKDDVNSLEFIEQTAREKLDMYYPNEKVYMDQGM